MSKSGLKSIIALRWLVGMTRINQINSLISVLNVADLKVRMQSTLISKIKKKISPKNRRECDQEITVGETEKAIKAFENNKSRGDDGLLWNFTKLLMKYLKQTYIGCTMKFLN